MNHYSTREWLRVGLLLAFAGGMLDAYTFLWRGQVLATAETGNMVMMGVSLVQGDWAKTISYLFPILAFALGVFASEVAKNKLEHRGNFPHWRRLILLLEVAIICVVAFLPLGIGDGVTNIAISFVSALQVASFRSFRGCPAFTTMCTGNLRSGMDGLSQWYFHHDLLAKAKAKLYFSIISAFIVGVLTCGLSSIWMGAHSVLLATIPLIIVYFIIRGACDAPTSKCNKRV